MNIEQIARLCHELNKSYCESIGDNSQVSWDDAEQWQKDSAIKGVEFFINCPNVTPIDQHNQWMLHKKSDDWIYGPIKNSLTKEHPCLVPYSELPIEQRIKDYLFRGVVMAFIEADRDK